MHDDIKPVAWMWDQAKWPDFDVRGRGWHPMMGRHDPAYPAMTRNVTPLYDRAALDAAVADALERALMSTDSTRLSDVSKNEPEANTSSSGKP